jgi:hypothetical protein
LIEVEISLEDLAVAHTALAGAITATEAVIAELATHSRMLPSDVFGQLIFSGEQRVRSLRRVMDALFDAEFQIRFPPT